MQVDENTAISLAKKFNIDLTVVPLTDWKNGLNIELEHGKKNTLTNVTDDNLDMTAKIAIAHLLEDPLYYSRLVKMESLSEEYWSGKNKPSIFIQDGGYKHKYEKYKTKYLELKKMTN